MTLVTRLLDSPTNLVFVSGPTDARRGRKGNQQGPTKEAPKTAATTGKEV